MSGFCNSPLARRRVLYTDTIEGGNQSMRDDLWAVSTQELNEVHSALQQAKTITEILQAKIKRMEEQQNAHRPDFLLNGTRFKLNFSTRGNVDVFHNYAAELQGRWVALVPAEDDCHLATPTASSDAASTADQVRDALEQQLIERRIALTPENEGGWHAAAYGDSDEPRAKGYGNTPSEAVSALQTTEGAGNA